MAKSKEAKESQSQNDLSTDDTPLSPDNNEDRKIYPIIMYPFSHPKDPDHIRTLYKYIDNLTKSDRKKYHRPITVLNRQTYYRNRNRQFDNLLEQTVKKCSKVIDCWSVDTCQMWLTGFGYAYDKNLNDKRTNDVFWLIPGDFNYNSDTGGNVLEEMVKLPNKVCDRECELCLGEITLPPNSAKQLIDTYGIYGLLYNWFPTEAQGIAKITGKPRTEFFAIGHNYLKHSLEERWYPYEQTIAILLHGMRGLRRGREIQKVSLGEIADEEQGRYSLKGAMQQVERTERVLKLYWRELHETQDRNWPDTFRKLDVQSEQIRGAAMVIFEQILRD